MAGRLLLDNMPLLKVLSPAPKSCCKNKRSHATNGCCHSQPKQPLLDNLVIDGCFQCLRLPPLWVNLQQFFKLPPCVEHLHHVYS